MVEKNEKTITIIKPGALALQIKILLFALAVTIIIGLFWGYFGDVLLYVIALVWIIALALCASAEISKKFKRIILEEGQAIAESGIITKETFHADYDRITSVNMKQDPIERMLKVGTIEIDTAGTEKIEVRMGGITEEDMKKIVSIIDKKGGAYRTEQAR
ncbi:MAG: PH domain-containing protein [Candidatus Micrarchaeota archaeon]